MPSLPLINLYAPPTEMVEVPHPGMDWFMALVNPIAVLNLMRNFVLHVQISS